MSISFSSTTRHARGARSRIARAVASPTIPPPMIAMSYVTGQYCMSSTRRRTPRWPARCAARCTIASVVRNTLTALAAAPRAIRRALGRASRLRLTRRPGPDEWSAVQVLGHLLDAEVTLAFRIRKLAAEPGGAIVAWD